MDLQRILFYGFAAMLIGAAMMVVASRNPVRGVLCLVLAFVASSGLWLLIQAEFLALVLILVYVGAVMTLFLFVVMMLNIDTATLRQGFVRHLPLGVLIVIMIVALMILFIGPRHFGLALYSADAAAKPVSYDNIKALADVLYTDYAYPFEIAGVLLLTAIVAAISLSFRGRRNSKSQRIADQLAARKEDRLQIVKMAPVSKAPQSSTDANKDSQS